jgi:hypothetical protein
MEDPSTVPSDSIMDFSIVCGLRLEPAVDLRSYSASYIVPKNISRNLFTNSYPFFALANVIQRGTGGPAEEAIRFEHELVCSPSLIPTFI